MLPKPQRLISNKDFQKIWKGGRAFYTRSLGFKILANTLAAARFGIVVGNKVSRLAVVRNRLKRRLREIIRAKIKEISPGYDLVISALPAALDKNYSELEKEVITGLKYFNLIKL